VAPRSSARALLRWWQSAQRGDSDGVRRWMTSTASQSVSPGELDAAVHQSGPMLGSVHDRNVDESGRYMRDQILRDIDVNAKRYVRMRAAHHPDPFDKQWLP